VVVVLDYLLVIIASPLPMVADIILRLIADRFPEIRKIMPTGLAKSMALGWLEKQLDKQVDATLDEIDRRVNAIKAEAMVSVSKSMQSLLEAEIAPLNRALRSLEVDQPTWSADEVARYESQLKGLYNRTNELSF
jgi:hypothetical protein